MDASEARAHVFPDTEEARLAAYADRSRMSFYTVDQTRAEVRGYAFLPAAFGAASFDASHAWTTKFPAEVGDIVGYAAKPANEVVHSWVRVLGDRSTLFKYLSPNIIFVAAAPTNAAAESAVSVHLLDAATGRVLYRVRHAEARGPVHAVVCENWVVYHYFNTKAGRHAMSVLEMFDDAEHRKGAAVAISCTRRWWVATGDGDDVVYGAAAASHHGTELLRPTGGDDDDGDALRQGGHRAPGAHGHQHGSGGGGG